LIEGLDDHTNEQIQEQQINQDLNEDSKNDVEGFIVQLWLLISVRRVHFSPHIVNPTFSGL
jgi:hypothetical protein